MAGRPVRSAWRALGSLVAIVAVGLGAVNVAATLAHQRERTHGAFRGPVRSIDISSSGGSIRVMGGQGSETTVDARIDYGLRRPSHLEDLKGDRLEIHSKKCGTIAGAFCSVDYTIHVPQGIEVNAASVGGDITVSGIHGNVDLSSSGGVVKIRDAATEEARVQSEGGDVTARGLVGASFDAVSHDGDVTLSFVAPPDRVMAESRGGSVLIEVPDTSDTYRVLVSSSGGDVRTRIRTDPTSSRLIRATSSGGDISVRYGGS